MNNKELMYPPLQRRKKWKISIVFPHFPLEGYLFKRLDGCHLILHFGLCHHAKKINPGKTARQEEILGSED